MPERIIPLKTKDSTIMRTYVAAGLADTPVFILVRLANSKCDRLRSRVAENHSTPVVILAKLAADRCSDVRIAVSENPRSPLGLLIILAKDEDADVRFSLADNSRVPSEILRMLTDDENPYIACRAMDTMTRKARANLRRSA